LEIQHLLDDDTILLEYSIGEKRSYVWVVGKKTIEGFALPARQELETTARRFTKAFADRNLEPTETAIQRRSRFKQLETEYEVSGALLSQMVLDPIGPLLGGKRLLIVSDGALQTVPFAALPVPADTTANLQNGPAVNRESSKRFLIDNHEIVTLASASVLAVQRNLLANRKPASGIIAVLANAVFQDSDPRVKRSNPALSRSKTINAHELPASTSRGGTYSPPDLVRALKDIGLDRISWLQYSRAEAEAIKKVAPKQGSMFALDFKASRSTAMSPQLSDFRIVHFSSHGIVDIEHPEFSGIILSLVDEAGNPLDGYIRLHEIYNLNLPAELVVLSACETGVGKQIKGEGLIALTRGFMYAGAKRVVASLWRVEDAATAELMAEFYKEMFSNGRQPAAALRAAQITMSRNRRWHAPYFWAGFVLQGDWQ
jgi:CHAT domain-containing protein